MAEHTEPVATVRHRCLWCRRTFASKGYAVTHAARCTRNPATRSCTTCVHFRKRPCCDTASADCGCMGRNWCALELFNRDDYERDCPSHEVPS